MGYRFPGKTQPLIGRIKIIDDDRPEN